MGSISLFTNVSLDGYIAGPDGDVSGFVQDFDAFDSSAGADMLLFGHTIYAMMRAFWPTPAAAEMQPNVASYMNATPRIVVSSAPFEADWPGTTVLSDNILERLQELREQHNLLVMGSNQLCVTLLHAGLLDTLTLRINPVLFGSGIPLFQGLSARIQLNRTNIQPYPSGVTIVTYQPEERASAINQ